MADAIYSKEGVKMDKSSQEYQKRIREIVEWDWDYNDDGHEYDDIKKLALLVGVTPEEVLQDVRNYENSLKQGQKTSI